MTCGYTMYDLCAPCHGILAKHYEEVRTGGRRRGSSNSRSSSRGARRRRTICEEIPCHGHGADMNCLNSRARA